MESKQKKQNLVDKVQHLCNILNTHGIKSKTRNLSSGGLKDSDWTVDDKFPEATFGGGICSNKQAFVFLKSKGLLDIGVCWQCGEEPIDKKYTFTDGFDATISHYICQQCYKERSGLF